MSRFEYLLAFVSIVIGLGLADLLLSLHRLIRARRRIRWHWLPLIWTAVVLLLILNYWYAFYDLGQLPFLESGWYFTMFLWVPILLFLLSASVLPDEIPEAELDLLATYMEQRGYFFSLLALYYLSVTIMAAVAEQFLSPSLHFVRLAVMLLALSLIRIRSTAYHGIIALLVLVMMVARLYVQRIG